MPHYCCPGANYNVKLIVVNDFKINQCINYEEIIVCTGSKENFITRCII